MKPFRNILVATDFSPASRPALRRALQLAAASRAVLWIGHVIPSTPPEARGGVVPRMYREMDLYLRDDAVRQLRRLTASARASGARARALLLRGVPHEAIARAARARRADLVVLGTHGRTGVARMIIGSVASRVVASAPCPVLTVRAR